MKGRNYTSRILLLLLIISYFSVPFADSFQQKNMTPSLRNEFQNMAEGNYSDVSLGDGSPFSHSENEIKEWNFGHISAWKDFAFADEDSAQLVIGVNEELAGSYVRLEALVARYGGVIVNKVRSGDSIRAIVVDVSFSFLSVLPDVIRNSGASKFVEPNLKYSIEMTPNDPLWSFQWGPTKINADKAWDTTTGDPSLIVAVIDTGIDYDHPDLAANYIGGGYDWVYNDNYPMDDHGHGTHVAGTIAAVTNNNKGIAGLAQVRVMAEKAFDSGGSGWEDDLAQAIYHAVDNGADILSNSWGGPHSELIYDAMKYAYNRGVLIVASAGNSGSSIKSYPAAYDEVIAVAATDEYDNTAWWSNYGYWIELAAPGVNIYSTVWDNSYAYMSGTSMACPHVSGVAALVWSRFPNMSRDQVRIHLQYTADDLGDVGFDEKYGYGRINAQKAVEMTPPEHEIIILRWDKPLYVEPDTTGIIQTTVFNYGTSDEANIIVQLWANDTLIDSANIGLLESGATQKISNTWTPTVLGKYNTTVYIVPVENETNLLNNKVWAYVHVAYPIKVLVLDSAGTDLYTETWDILNEYWPLLGNQLIFVDYETLNKDNILYEDINATDADVLIISCAYAWQFTDSEIEAIAQYVYEGHGLIATAGTFYYGVPNNNKLASLFGMNETVQWTAIWTDLLNLMSSSHPLFDKISNPYVIGGSVGSAVSFDGRWDSNELVDGEYLALGYDKESSIVEKDGLLYISPWLEVVPQRYHHHLQLFYNAITWSRYQKPEHDLAVSLDVPQFLLPDENVTIINATVANIGLNNETDVTIHLYIDGEEVKNETASTLLTDSRFKINYTWNVVSLGTYNVTAYVAPVVGESRTKNNIVTTIVKKMNPLINPQEGQWARYRETISDIYANYTYLMGFSYDHYISKYQINVTTWTSMDAMNSTGWMIVNVVNRKIEDSSVGGIGFWFYGWIEKTNLTIGSTVNLLEGTATVVGSRMIEVGLRSIDCWELFYMYYGTPYTFWYDKETGLWISFETEFESYYSAALLLEATNIPIGVVYEHDLTVLLEAPDTLWLGSTTVLKSTVFNIGMHGENFVSLALSIDGKIVNSTIVSQLSVNSSETVEYRWTPSTAATFNVTAYALPLPNENVTSNNFRTKMVKVKALKGRVLFDQTHWTDSVYNFADWITSLDERGYVVEINAFTPITLSQLSRYDVFVIPQARDDYSLEELKAIQTFVNNGGGLLVLGDDMNAIYTALTSFASIYWYPGKIVPTYITDIVPHRISEGVNSVYLPPTQAVIDARENARAIIQDSMGNIVLAIYEKLGRVVGFVNDESFMDWCIQSADNMKLANNIIDWLVEEDTTLPFISIASPQDGAIIGNNSIIIQWIGGDDESGIHYYSVYLNDDLVANTTENGYLISNLVENSNIIAIIAYDWSGNNASDRITINVDTIPPAVNIAFPANHSYLKGLVPVNFTSSDAHFELVELYIDGTLAANYTFAGDATYSWNTTEWLDMQHVVLLKAKDTVGNTNFTQIEVVVDNTLPWGGIIQPANMTYLNGECNISVHGNDVNLDNTELFINQELKQVWVSSGLYDFVWDTAEQGDGIYAIKLVVHDKAGNSFEKTIMVVVDNTKPEVAINAPAEDAELDGVATIDFTATDNNLATLFLYIDNAAFNVTGLTSYQWNSGEVGDGQHIIRLVAADKAGNTKETQRNVTTTNIEKTYVRMIDELQMQMLALSMGMLVLLAVAAIMVFLNVRRRLPKSPTAE